MRLGDAGIKCDIDLFEDSPPDGWPTWCKRQVEECDFCAIVCTETYARRFAGNEMPGQGKGATWEGRLIRQCLYESPHNIRFIPVIFGAPQADHIPIELRDVTYYDLNTDSGYESLFRRLTHQPRLQPRTAPNVRKYLPTLVPHMGKAMALLRLCPEPIPLDVIARITDRAVEKLRKELQPHLDARVLALMGDTARMVDRSAEGIPEISNDVIGVALEAILDFIKRDERHTNNRPQIMNAVILARAADLHRSSVQVSRVFGDLQSLLKSSGNKQLVLEVARLSIRASKILPGRGESQARDEALATICGISWVYQRTGRLREARVEAENSLSLGKDIRWDRNTAFCKKCIGRLSRLEAEATRDHAERARLLDDSVGLLQDAIRRFKALNLALEVGDCFSLLARTHLTARNLTEAEAAIREADGRLQEPTNKDYLDLQIVRGDYMAFTDLAAAESEYTGVLSHVIEGDAQTSEIVARAYYHRGLVRARLGKGANAQRDFQRAAEIWEWLDDPTADYARWEIERRAGWVRGEAESLLMSERVGVRVRVAQLVTRRGAGRGLVRARRADIPMDYLRGLIGEAAASLATEQPKW